MSSKLPGALCHLCPLQTTGTLVSPETNGTALAVVGEQPGKQEVEQGRPFVGPSGQYFDRACSQAGLPRSKMRILNAVNCYGPRLTTAEYRKAAAACQPAVVNAVGDIPKVLVLGARPLAAFTPHDTIMDWFGWPLEVDGREIFPNIHPSAALRKAPLRPVFTHIMRRAGVWFRGNLRWEWPPVYIEQDEASLAALQRIAKAPVIGFDVETAGTSPMFDPCLAIGVASTTEAVCLRWPLTSDAHYEALQAVLQAAGIKTAHNKQHDLLTCAALGLAVAPPVLDTLLGHVAEFPQLPHNLSFVAAIEFASPRWKSDFHGESELKGAAKFTQADPQSLRIYCGRDALMGARIAVKQIKRLGWTA